MRRTTTTIPIVAVTAAAALLSAIVFTAAVVAQPALAASSSDGDRSDEGKEKVREVKEINTHAQKIKNKLAEKLLPPHPFVFGSGVATSHTDGKNFKSEIRVMTTTITTADSSAKTTTTIDNLRARDSVIAVVSEDGAIEVYKAVPGSWAIEKSDDGLMAKARGTVTDQDGKTYDVALTGYEGHGGFWSVAGSLGDVYDLHYVAKVR